MVSLPVADKGSSPASDSSPSLKFRHELQGSSRKLAVDSAGFKVGRSGQRNHDHRDSVRKPIAQTEPEAFPDAAFEAISHDGITDSARYRYSEPLPRFVAKLSRIQHEVSALDTHSLALQPEELGAAMQPICG